MQQEKSKLVNDMNKLKKKIGEQETQFEQHSQKYETAIKEKMLMKLEKDRLWAKVESLESNLNHLQDNKNESKEFDESKFLGSPQRTQ